MRLYARQWEYDEVGNILKLIHQANNNSWTRDYVYDANSNRLSSTEVGGTTVNYAYNPHGSMASMPHLQSMEWDFAERLCHVARGTTEAYYNYDASGQRVRKVVEKNGIVETRLYLGGFEIFRKKVGNVLELERETLHIMDDKRRIAIVETKTIDNGIAVNNPVPVQRYQFSNNIESATLELDENASIISYEEYYPYGDTSYQAGRSASEVSQKRYRYTGKEKDEESGLYYHGARYYACWLGRWTAVDPAGLVDGLNLYMYCRGNPVRFMDPSGNEAEDKNQGYVVMKFPNPLPAEWSDPTSIIGDKQISKMDPIQNYVSFVGNAKKADVSQYTIDVVSKITSEVKMANIYVTSTKRNSDGQIDAMYNNIKTKGVAAQLKLYAKKGQSVINAYSQALSEGKTESEIKAAMKEKAVEVNFISAHSSTNYNKLNAVDIGNSSFGNNKSQRDEFIEQAKKEPSITKIFNEETCVHLEIKQP